MSGPEARRADLKDVTLLTLVQGHPPDQIWVPGDREEFSSSVVESITRLFNSKAQSMDHPLYDGPGFLWKVGRRRLAVELALYPLHTPEPVATIRFTDMFEEEQLRRFLVGNLMAAHVHGHPGVLISSSICGLTTAMHLSTDGAVEEFRGPQTHWDEVLASFASPVCHEPRKAFETDLLTIPQTAEALGVSRSTVSRAITNARLRGVRLGNQIFVPFDELDKFERFPQGRKRQLS